MSHQPRKRFGQNFLHDQGVIAKIVNTIHPQAGQTLIEIGPGQGAITLPLLEACGELHAVELDRDLIEPLKVSCAGYGRLHVHQADALRFDFCELQQGSQRIRVVGNLPYNISTPLLFHLLEQADCIEDMFFMLQKEVVDRMAAGPGDEAYGRLSIMVQYHCRAERLFLVRPGAFNPPPKVDSAIVRLVPHRTPPVELLKPELFRQLVNQAFSQRRKTLRNSLKNHLSAEAIQAAGIDPGLRPETLSLQQFAALANAAATSAPV